MEKREQSKFDNIPTKIKLKLRTYARVLKITKKPSSEEFQAIVKVSGLGILLIGAIGFVIFLAIALVQQYLL